MNRSLVFAASVALVMLIAVGVASGQLPVGGSDDPELKSFAELPALKSVDKPSSETRDEIRGLVAKAPSDSILASIDPANARGVDIAGGAKAWIAQDSDHGVCLLDRDVSGALGSSCTTLDEFNDSGLVTVSAGSDGKYVVTVVTVPGTDASIHRSGATGPQPLSQHQGVSSAVLVVGDTLNYRDVAVDTAEIDAQRKKAVEEIASQVKK